MSVPDLAGKLLGALPGRSWFTRSRAKAEGAAKAEPARPESRAAAARAETARAEATPAEPSKSRAVAASNAHAHAVMAGAIAAQAARRFSPMAKAAGFAIFAGALGGAVATAALSKYYGAEGGAAMFAGNSELESTVSRLDSDVQALKTNAEQVAQTEQVLTQTTERLDRLERAQADAAAKLMRIGEGAESPRVRSPAVSAMAAVPPAPVREAAPAPQRAAAAAPAPRPAARTTDSASSRLPVLEGWTLRDVNRGVALIEGRRGFYEVLAGDPIPGLGKVDAIRRQDGRWVVVTSKGLVVAR